MSDFHFVAKVDEIQENEIKLVEIDEELVLIIKVDGQFFCIDDVCTHDGGTLCDGTLHGHEIACPRHGARFDVRNGNATRMPATQPTGAHEVKIEDGQVFVKINQA